MKKLLFILMILINVAGLSYSQSSYLEINQNGLLLNGGFSSDENTTGLSGGLGYSFLGKFDLGMSLGQYTFKEKLYGEDLKYTAISPYVSYIPIKQNKSIPLTVALNAGYVKAVYSNKLFDQYDMQMSGDFLAIGTTLYTKISVSESMAVQPNIMFSYMSGESKLIIPTGTTTESSKSTIFGLNVDLIFKSSPKHSFIVSPGLSFGDGNTSIGITLGYLIAK